MDAGAAWDATSFRAAGAVQAALPPDTIYYSDMTQFAYVANEVLDMPAPGLWHHPWG